MFVDLADVVDLVGCVMLDIFHSYNIHGIHIIWCYVLGMGLPARVTPRRRGDFVLVKESACRRSWRCRDLFVHDDVVRAVRPGYMFT